ncbi:hypothetical protein [Polaromonas sp. CG_9.11]|uniref:hypothetical protein n=1 Tax=Polaromonas sp. CG_9.11 TaxID=2787730 RepID=UPI001A339CA4|nr:hypothetical protein [Polaromonas sp. CG_9.11]MBG6075790.1 hypothetical protein [Polaromonas sp. CG_9.11]
MKTQHGQSAFQSRTVLLTPRQRAAFILFDGKRDLQEVMKATVGLGVTPEDIGHLVSQGLLAPREEPAQAPAAASAPASKLALRAVVPSPAAAASPALPFSSGPGSLPSATAQARYSKCYPIATRLTAGLGLRGFRLNLAVEAASDLDKLRELAPRIKDAVGPEKFRELQSSLYD